MRPHRALSLLLPLRVHCPARHRGAPLAVSVKRESISLQEFIQGNTGPGNEVLEQERVTLAGQPAVRLELRTTDQSVLLPRGTREYV